jgi:hypothetical protein
MKTLLKKIPNELFYFANGKKIKGIHDGIAGNVSDIIEDVSNIIGNVSNIIGNVSGIQGIVSDLAGNLNECEITPDERKAGINVADLIDNS